MIKKHTSYGYKRWICLCICVFMLFGACVKKNKDSIDNTEHEGDKIVSQSMEVEDEDVESLQPVVEDSRAVETFQIPETLVTYKEIFKEDFEGDEHSFVTRGEESLTLETIDNNTYLVSKNRKSTWNGPSMEIGQLDLVGKKIRVTGKVKYVHDGIKEETIECKFEKNQSEYIPVTSILLHVDTWTEFEKEINVPEQYDTLSIYFETKYTTEETTVPQVDIYLDDIKLEEVIVSKKGEKIPSLMEYYKDYFYMGVGVEASTLKDKDMSDTILYHFNSITMGNEMKADYVLDYSACIADLNKTNTNPALHFNNLNIGLDYAKEHGLILRGHTLVWHSQTPEWFFKVDYSKEKDAPLVSKEVMIARMESYIRQIFEHINSNYPGVVYAYDVVNEGVLPGDGDKNGLRVNDSLWYQIIGPDYIEKAFEFTRKYAAPEVKLFYNDFNTYEMNKRLAIYDLCKRLKEKGLIDGIGMQSHITIDYPSLIEYEKTIEKFSELGLEIHITELDMDLEDNSTEMLMKQGARYKRLFLLYKRLIEQNRGDITSITFWGLEDSTSWLNDGTASYPLLFDYYLQPKPAYYGVIQEESIPLF